jgi:hypothetical protein
MMWKDEGMIIDDDNAIRAMISIDEKRTASKTFENIIPNESVW